jgi:hypothetical protein
MVYKGQYKPSYLLDVEANTWEPIEKCIPLLEKSSFVPFHYALNNMNNEGDSMKGTSADRNGSNSDLDCLKSVLVIFSGMLVPITVSLVTFSMFLSTST